MTEALATDGDFVAIDALDMCIRNVIYGSDNKKAKRLRDEWHAVSAEFSKICNSADDSGVCDIARRAISYLLHHAEEVPEYDNSVLALQHWLQLAASEPTHPDVLILAPAAAKFTQANLAQLKTWLAKVEVAKPNVALPYRFKVRSMDHSASTRCEAEFRAMKMKKAVGTHTPMARFVPTCTHTCNPNPNPSPNHDFSPCPNPKYNPTLNLSLSLSLLMARVLEAEIQRDRQRDAERTVKRDRTNVTVPVQGGDHAAALCSGLVSGVLLGLGQARLGYARLDYVKLG